MNIKRAILSGVLVWLIGVSIFTTSEFIHLLEDPEMQANLALSIFLIPVASLGAAFYYKKCNEPGGFAVGLIMVVTAIILDAVITVPFLIIPNGGSYLGFFISPAFWLLVIEYLAIVFIYWKIKHDILKQV